MEKMAKSTNAKAMILNLVLMLFVLHIFFMAEARFFGGEFWSKGIIYFSFYHNEFRDLKFFSTVEIT